MKAEQQRMKEAREAELLKDATFAPQINTKSNSFAKKRVSNADIYTRLNEEKHFVPEPEVVEAPKKVLPKEDVEKIFRRLSITNTVSTEVGNTFRATGELPQSPEHKALQRKKSIVLPEKDIDSLFNRLHTTSYDHEEGEPAVKPVMKQATPKQVNDIVDRLSKNPAEAWLENQSPRRASRILSGLGSPSNDSYDTTNSLSSSIVGTPRTDNNRKESFRDPTTSSNNKNHSPSERVAVNPGDFPPTPPARVQPASKFSNGANSSSKSSGIAADVVPSVAVEDGVAALPKPPAAVAPATPAAVAVPPPAPVATAAAPAAPVGSHIPKPTTPSSTKHTVPATTTAAAAPTAGTSSKSGTSSAGGSGGAANPDFFSKLEASLAFLETQLDSKPSTSAKLPAAAKTATTAAATH